MKKKSTSKKSQASDQIKVLVKERKEKGRKIDELE